MLTEKVFPRKCLDKVLFCGLSKKMSSRRQNTELFDGQSSGTLKRCRGHIVSEKPCSMSFDAEQLTEISSLFPWSALWLKPCSYPAFNELLLFFNIKKKEKRLVSLSAFQTNVQQAIWKVLQGSKLNLQFISTSMTSKQKNPSQIKHKFSLNSCLPQH